jgi:transposase-like protein
MTTMRMKVKVEKKEPKEVVTAVVCPHCRGTNMFFEGGYLFGRKYHCADCHYIGSFVLERKVVVTEDEEVED